MTRSDPESYAERESLLARIAQLETDNHETRKRIAKLLERDAPPAPPTLGVVPLSENKERSEWRLEGPTPDAALAPFVAALQERLSCVGWARAENGSLTWKCEAYRIGIEVRVVSSDEETIVSVDYSLLHQRAQRMLTRILAGALPTLGIMFALLFRPYGLGTIALAGGSLLAGIAVWWWGDRGHERLLQSTSARLNELTGAIATDLQNARNAAMMPTRVAIAEDSESAEALAQGAQRGLPR